MGRESIALYSALVIALAGCGGSNQNSPHPQSTYAIYVSTLSNSLANSHSTVHSFAFDPSPASLREVGTPVTVPATTMLSVRPQHDFLIGGGGLTQKIWPLGASGILGPETDSLIGYSPIISTDNGRYLLDVESDSPNAIGLVIQAFSFSAAGKLQDSGQRMIVDPAPPGPDHTGVRYLTLLGSNSASSDGERLWVDVRDFYRGYSDTSLLSVRVDPQTGALDAPALNPTFDHIAPARFGFAGSRILASDTLGVHLFREESGRLTQLAICCQPDGFFAAQLATHPGGALAFVGIPGAGTILTLAVSDASLTPLQTTSCCKDDLLLTSLLSVTNDGKYLLVGLSRGLKIFRIEAETGRLTQVVESSLPEEPFSILAFALSH